MQEAFMVRSHPQWIRTREIVRSGRIGELRSMLGVFSYFNREPENIRNIPALGGGGLMDIGCYLINTSRFIFDREPERVVGLVDRDPEMHIDRMASILLDFGNGHSVGTCSTQMVFHQRMQIFGTRGRIELEIPFNAPPDRPVRISVDSGADLYGGGIERIEFDTCNQYTIQGDLFSKAILDGADVPSPLEDAIRNMSCIDAVFRSTATGRWEVPV
jgi:predicted dehydrogenase